LVEDLTKGREVIAPYYYYVDAKNSDGLIIAEGIVFAMENDKASGKIGKSCQASDDTVPISSRSKDDAVNLVRSQIGVTGNAKAKAVFVYGAGDDFNWGWAVQFENNTRAGEPITYWVDHTIYDENFIKTRNLDFETAKNKVLIGEIPVNVFDTEKTRTAASTPIKIKPLKYGN
jgi:hypothetical protein